MNISFFPFLVLRCRTDQEAKQTGASPQINRQRLGSRARYTLKYQQRSNLRCLASLDNSNNMPEDAATLVPGPVEPRAASRIRTFSFQRRFKSKSLGLPTKCLFFSFRNFCQLFKEEVMFPEGYTAVRQWLSLTPAFIDNRILV